MFQERYLSQSELIIFPVLRVWNMERRKIKNERHKRKERRKEKASLALSGRYQGSH